MINTTIALIKNQRFFYRNYYFKGINLLMGLLIVALLSTGLIFYLATHRSVPAFYSCTTDGMLSLLKSMPQPNFSQQPLLS